ncbi:type 1 glutamine amidotransferase [Propionicimonas sp.]|uniref:type 1 glutamine amidotransferase n=1 Tax=Propionicimonas sp. TaxID=1955623 RepID=UPI0017B53F39|nr:type 1 glutamine amidotransferase [Propionicimonas sp.]MBU3977856.1 type 1 glutamine amidotransferase [Actinomycetota bacterium]MBA3021920.1 type 1 glutamine amidotransferase [Propionicimonas sp.]MBU3987633.1 type 1 glutamine amidotransferase [Actinomycetota bacterium]MBU4007355.1 type 1 glutamine amidotransferase [Actinomycetota bacterium]MBU4065699.1 type 1 glutamine amidotransferase [Actinomycetota bacterium]
MATPARATILQLDPEVPVDRFGPWLSANRLLVRAVPVWQRGVPAAATLGDGVVILGGTMSAHDGARHSWIEPLKQLMIELVDSDVPTLGICLGHQLLAEAFGGQVRVAEPRGGEHGACEVYWTGAARTDPLLQRLAVNGSSVVAESHADVVTELPPQATLLGSSQLYRNQAFRVGSAVGVQFHPEASPDLMGRWAELRGHDAREMRRSMQRLDSELSRTGRLLAQAFSAQLQAPPIAA